ncbi:PREDICTED: glutathione S-transferase T3-like [Camelina sativa]|uniref:Glutathione S-transferase T3-like n=1 Tax=Camelina sativa TaxID=90675 RepID=A0ABM0URV8_CAMSA|nr:PREDICTED: glutathione S-transferase T3-like [Camelina sativa]
MDPYSQDSGFVDLLTSQTTYNTLETNSYAEDPSLGEGGPKERRERRKWSHTEDALLINAWLNTSKDAVTSNQQKGNTFWHRIADYYAKSPKLAGTNKREPLHYKGRWQKINDHVSKFVGSYHAATKERSSSQSEDDVMKMAYQIFANDYKMKLTLEHAWRELRHEQKWCLSYATKDNGSSKRRKIDDQTSNSGPVMDDEEDQARPPGIKAAKAKGKRHVSKPTSSQAVVASSEGFESMWDIR